MPPSSSESHWQPLLATPVPGRKQRWDQPLLAMLLFSAAVIVAVRSHTGIQFTPKLEIQHLWGAYTPAKPFVPAPSHCQITQVNIIQRHGARFPTLGAAARIANSLTNLQFATHYTDPRLEYLTNYTYSLGVDDLVPSGASQFQEAGQEAFIRYSRLISQTNILFFQSSSGARVVESATNWTLGITCTTQ